MTVTLQDNKHEIADLVGRNYVTVLRQAISSNTSLKANPHLVKTAIKGAVGHELGNLVAAELSELGESHAMTDYDEHELREQTISRRVEIAASMIEKLVREHFFRDLGLMLYRDGIGALAKGCSSGGGAVAC